MHEHEAVWSEDAARYYEMGLINATQASIQSGNLAVSHETTPPAQSDPVITPEQDKLIEHYVDHGFGYPEAMVRAGVINPWDFSESAARAAEKAAQTEPNAEKISLPTSELTPGSPKLKTRKSKARPLSNRMLARVDVRQGEVRHKPEPYGHRTDI